MNRPWLPLYVNDYFADTLDLTTEQHGVYVLLLMIEWRRGGGIPNDPAFIKRALGAAASDMHGNRFNRLVQPILERFFALDSEGNWRNNRLGKELEKANKFSGKQKEKAEKRWAETNKNNDLENAAAMPASAQQSQSQSHSKDSSLRSESPTASDDAPGGLLDLVEPSADRTLAARIEEAFEKLRSVYPKRDGQQPRKPAFEKFGKLVRKGVDPERIIEAAKVYAAEVRRHGKENTPFVKQVVPWLNTAPWEQIASATTSQTETVPADRWRSLLGLYAESGVWHWRALSPEPGKPGCKIPTEIIDEYAPRLKRFVPELAGAAE
jgi:uncharacterized protein YdaU (DUF1376 family)